MTVDLTSTKLRAHARLDEMALAYFRRARRNEPPAASEAELADAIATHASLGHLADPRLAHPAPGAPDPATVTRHSRRIGSIHFDEVAFPSAFHPEPSLPLSAEWEAVAANRTVHVWTLQHDDARPWVVCVHGSSMGHPRIDLSFFRAVWLHRRLGLNVAIPVLPLHGPRRAGHGSDLAYPSLNTISNLHGSRQSASDVRRTIAHLRHLDDEPVMVFGISLGGHVSGLVAGLEDDIATVLVGAPVVDLDVLMRAHETDRGAADAPADLDTDLARRLGSIASPLSFDCRVPLAGRSIYVGSVDRLVDPADHAARLETHWGHPETLWFEGGHVALAFHRPIGPFVARALTAHAVASTEHR